MTTITKEFNLLDIEDIEQALSEHFDKNVSISEVSCSLVYYIPCDTEEPSGMSLDFSVDGMYCDSYELFKDPNEWGHKLNGKPLSLDENWLPVEEILNFDVSVFKSFDSYTDNSD